MKKLFAILLAVVMVFTFVTVAACNGDITVKVTLHVTDDGTPIIRNHVVGKDDLPTNVTNGNLKFDGWYYDNNTFDLPFDKDNTDARQVVYAKWTEAGSAVGDTVTLTLDPNYAGSSIITYTIDKNTAFASLPETFERSGYTFNGWYTQSEGGFVWTKTMPVSVNTVLYAHWTKDGGNGGNGDVPTHTHDFGDSYFMYVKCSVAGCNEIGRNESSNPFRDDFEYSYTQADRTAMDNAYNALTTDIDNGNVSINSIVSSMDDFEGLIADIEYNYQVATVMFSVNYDDEWEQKSTLIGNAYNDWFMYYYTLCSKIYDSRYSDNFFTAANGWTDEEVEYALEMAEVYSASEDNLQNVADALATEYNNLFDELYNSDSEEIDWSQLYEPYYKYVQANNNIAAQYGNKYDNYMDYAYAQEYGREYTPADVATMRNYVKTVIAPIFIEMSDKYGNMQYFFDNSYNFYDGMEDDYGFFDALAFESLFTFDEDYAQNIYDATNYIGNYFKYLNNNKTGSKEINFYKQVNELFKNGNYFTASDAEEGAYTYYIRAKETPVMYFDDTYDWLYGYSYSTAFTFVHEFGHYYADIYTDGGNYSMDHAEIHSQGNEMLFLAWLKDNCPQGVEYGYEYLQTSQLVDILCTIVQATIVDEFEQAVYSNTYGDGEFKDGIAYSQYGDLYAAIVNSYGDGMLDILGEEYWLYVVVDNSAYYISYAMSALPSVEIYAKAMTDGLDAARDSYFKLLTCMDVYEYVTFSQALEYAGLANPFQKAMYDNIAAYFTTLLA